MTGAGLGVYAGGMSAEYICCICGLAHQPPQPPEFASVRCNVRHYATGRFGVWRCSGCGSIHAGEDVDLRDYYKHYPFFGQKLDWALRAGYRGLLRRLRRAGLRRKHRVLDFGCGSGLLVQFLQEQGYDAVGYDPYSTTHCDPEIFVEKTYDVVIAQDVVEHAPEPMEILKTLDSLAAPGGIIVIGTPNATSIDLADTEKFVHPLHQPYHRHIFAIDALCKAGEGLGWQKLRTHSTPYTNMPLLSLPFLHHYMRASDGTIDALFDRSVRLKLWLDPRTYFYLLLGYFLCNDADILAIFKTTKKKQAEKP